MEKVLRKLNNYNYKSIYTPLDMNTRFEKNKGKSRSLVGIFRVIDCPMYVMTCSRANIPFAIGKLSRYTCNLRCMHWYLE